MPRIGSRIVEEVLKAFDDTAISALNWTLSCLRVFRYLLPVHMADAVMYLEKEAVKNGTILIHCSILNPIGSTRPGSSERKIVQTLDNLGAGDVAVIAQMVLETCYDESDILNIH